MCALDDSRHGELLQHVLQGLAAADLDVVPVLITQRMQRQIREWTGQADPYRTLKTRMNRLALELAPAVAAAIRRQSDPREAAVRIAIGGNLLDAGSKSRLTPEELPGLIETVWTQPLMGNVAELFAAAAQAKRILYLADNAGEIVFDRFLIEALPMEKVTVAVRGAPVINDATMEDARIAGLSDIVSVISNGSDAPGTLLHECSPSFRDVFAAADLIIAKGQGNYETLSDEAGNRFFLLTVKCPLIAADIGAPVGTLVVHHRAAEADR